VTHRTRRFARDVEAAPVVVPEQARFTGLVSFLGSARVEGRLDGRVVSRGRLLVALTGQVEGEIDADEVVVAGILQGRVRARRVELLPEARVSGTLETRLLLLAEGSQFNGTCRAGNGSSHHRGAKTSDRSDAEASMTVASA
jgi:cytoskeletal protein CcmA (bactofilin family)